MHENIGDQVGIVRHQVAGIGAECRDQAIRTDGGVQAARIALFTGAILAGPHRCASLAITHKDVFVWEETGPALVQS